MAGQVVLALANARMVDQIRSLAYFDSLTGLPNRVSFKRKLTEELERSAIQQRKLAVCFLDLDHFSRINDTLGHRFGDRLVQEVAHRVRACCRKHAPAAEVARLGGDEFTVIVPDLPDDDMISQLGRAAAGIVQYAVRARWPRGVHLGQHRHRGVPDRRDGPREPAQERRPRDVPGEEAGPEHGGAVRDVDGHLGQQAAHPRGRPPARDRPGAVCALVPAGRGPQDRPGRERRGAGALGAPDRWTDPAGGVHPALRGDRAHQRAGRVDPAGGLLPEPELGRGRARLDPDRDQPLGPAAAGWRHGGAGAPGAGIAPSSIRVT